PRRPAAGCQELLPEGAFMDSTTRLRRAGALALAAALVLVLAAPASASYPSGLVEDPERGVELDPNG
ncbi:MAG: hypothetical protein ACLF0P_10725, partial [Thermoanaerobaculia bacterium]